jgi:DNA-binding transcriptional LysR family regulator
MVKLLLWFSHYYFYRIHKVSIMYGAINLHQLEIFLSVTERRSFSKAAMGLHTSQPSVSMQIRNLEQALGVRLFDRLGHAVYLTREGELVLEYAKRIFSGISSLQSDLENLKEIKVGRLAVGASRVPSATTVPRAFALFKKQYPHTEIAVKTALSRQIEQWVLDDEIDLAIVAGDPVSRALVKEFYYEEQLIAVLPHRHPLAKRATVLPEHVIQETVLLSLHGQSHRIYGEGFCRSRSGV